MVTIKYDGLGQQVWLARYEHYGDCAPHALVVDQAQNVYVTGYSIDRGTSQDFTTLKYVQNAVPETRLDLAQRLPTGEFQFRLTAEPGRWYDVLSSSNLAQWISLTNLANPTGQVPFVDGGSSETRRFYRAAKMP